jgi:hypothetical protein
METWQLALLISQLYFVGRLWDDKRMMGTAAGVWMLVSVVFIYLDRQEIQTAREVTKQQQQDKSPVTRHKST